MAENSTGKIQVIKTAPPPVELPILGKASFADTVFFGRTNYAVGLDERRYVFGLKQSDRRRNLYIIGKSGTGKTKIMELLIRQDIAAGRGVLLLDPHGELIEDVLNFIPENRITDVVLVNPGDTSCPIAFNPLADVPDTFKPQLVQGLIEVLSGQFGAGWNANMEYITRFILLALLDYPGATLSGVVKILTDSNYRASVITHIKNQPVKHFWEQEFSAWSRQEKVETEAIPPLVNKFSQFMSDPYLASIFTLPEHRISLPALIEKKKIVLVNLSKGLLGKENAGFFGSLFIIDLKKAGMERLKVPEGQRSDFYIYIDEFHHLVTETFEHLLFEGKKYHFAFTIAHQYLGQIIDHFRGSVFGNVGTFVVFRVGGEDAEKLEAEFSPVFKAKDMTVLGRQEFYIRMMIDGQAVDAFSAEALKVLPAGHPSHRSRIMELSRQTYCHPALPGVSAH